MMSSDELFFHKKNDTIVCHLCFRKCHLHPEQVGICGVNSHRDGSLRFLSYGMPTVMQNDPIEKKPLFHVRPGTSIFSLGTTGCAFTCPFCQNISLVQTVPPTQGPQYSHDEILDKAQSLGCESIAFTYNEPSHSWLWYRDLAHLAQKRGMLTVMVTNGCMGDAVCKDMVHCIDAVNIDLKSGSEVIYKEQLGGDRNTVLENIETLYKNGVWVELTTLLVPGISDSMEDLQVSMDEMYNMLGPLVPWHLSAYYPAYKYRAVATSHETVLQRCEQLRDRGFSYIYAGNIATQQETCCPSCQGVMIYRQGNRFKNMLKNGACPDCFRPMEGLL